MEQYHTDHAARKRLPTALQVALKRAELARKAEWARRFDPASWRCRRDGAVWIAEGPCGQRMEFRKAPNGEDVLCSSASGRRYELVMGEDLQRYCTCPDAARGRENGCKHVNAYRAVKQAAAMAKELAK